VGDLDALRGRERKVLPNIPTIGGPETATLFHDPLHKVILAADRELPR
jgi:hypothetical protein